MAEPSHNGGQRSFLTNHIAQSRSWRTHLYSHKHNTITGKRHLTLSQHEGHVILLQGQGHLTWFINGYAKVIEGV